MVFKYNVNLMTFEPTIDAHPMNQYKKDCNLIKKVSSKASCIQLTTNNKLFLNSLGFKVIQ